LVSEVSRQIPDKLDLLLDREPTNNGLEDGANRHSVFADQATIINIGEHTHQESTTLSAKTGVRRKILNILAVHPVSHPPVSRDTMTEILDIKGTLKSGSEKAAERSDERRKNGHHEEMEVVGRIRERRNVSSKL